MLVTTNTDISAVDLGCGVIKISSGISSGIVVLDVSGDLTGS